MRFLIDTHILIWQLSNDQRLTSRLRALLDDTDNDVFVSDISFFEIVIKVRTGKMRLRLDDVIAENARQGYRHLALEQAHLRALETLPRLHGDPFDHLLIAQAIAADMTIMTCDSRFADYPVRVA